MNCSVVLVDKDAAALKTVSEVLEAEGFVPAVALNGQEALGKISHARPWLLIVGDDLPDMSGPQMVSSISREQRPLILVLREKGTVQDGDVGWGGHRSSIFSYKAYKLTRPDSFTRRQCSLFRRTGDADKVTKRSVKAAEVQARKQTLSGLHFCGLYSKPSYLALDDTVSAAISAWRMASLMI